MMEQIKPHLETFIKDSLKCIHIPRFKHLLSQSPPSLASALQEVNKQSMVMAAGTLVDEIQFTVPQFEDLIINDECDCIVWVKDQSQTVWYDYEIDAAPTWRFWGEEKVDGAIYMVYLKKVRYHHPARSINQESDDDEKISHLEWETVRVRFLKAGTLDKLIESLTSDIGELESSFVNVFLATYRTFATTGQVLGRMIDRYAALAKAKPESPHLGMPPHMIDAHKKSIRLTLQVWLDAYIDDFREPPLFATLHQIQDFAKTYLPDSDLHVKVNYKISKLKKEEQIKNSPVLERILSLDELSISCPLNITNGFTSPVSVSLKPPYEFVNIPELIFAQQLTRMDAILFQRLIPHQCLGSVWSQRDKAKSQSSPTVVATIDQFNAVIYRVQSTILVQTELKAASRAKLISKWIDVAQQLRLLKNFSSLKAIISSLQSNPIYRLRRTWGALPKEKVELYTELERIFSEENNQLNQRELLIKEGTAKHAETTHAQDRHLHKAMEKLYCNPLAVNHGTIPYLGTFLTDLTMIDTAIPDTVDDGQLINFEKKRKEFEVLAQIRLLQGAANAYNFEHDEHFNRWWDSVLVLDSKEVFDLSCLIENEHNNNSNNTTNSSSGCSAKSYNKKGYGHHKSNSLGENSIISSIDSFSISQNDSISNQRKMSTSSNCSSVKSLSISSNNISSSAVSIASSPEKSQKYFLFSAEKSSLYSGKSAKSAPDKFFLHSSKFSEKSTKYSENFGKASDRSFLKCSRSLENSFDKLSILSAKSATLDSGSSHASSRILDESPQTETSLSPYINSDFYIIKVSMENSPSGEDSGDGTPKKGCETGGVNLYKSIYLNNSERTTSVIEKAMAKHDINGDPKDFTLTQILKDGEIVLPPSVNVFYAIKLTDELKFVLRRRRHGDEKTIVRLNPSRNHKIRKKLVTLKAF